MEREETVHIDVEGTRLAGDLAVPERAAGLVLFAHGSGSSRHSGRNRQVARSLRGAGLGTLLMDLLTADEEAADLRTRALRFDVDLLAQRVAGAIDWVREQPGIAGLPVGLFGGSTGAAAALVAAAARPQAVGAVVSRGGRGDLAGPALARVRAPTLLIVGERDDVVIDLNRAAAAELQAEHRLEIVPGAGHLFEEPGALGAVAELAAAWFSRQLAGQRSVR